MGARHRDPNPDAGQVLIAKPRRCLMCSGTFNSSWAGERICKRCKGGTAYGERLGWADDEPLPVVQP